MRIAILAAIAGGILGLGLTAPSAQSTEQTNAPPAPPQFHLINIPSKPASNAAVDNPYMPDYPTLAFDAMTKQYDAKPAATNAPFTFHLTNVWTNDIVITKIHPSCGCTTVKAPQTPWTIPPGGVGELEANVNLENKPPGLITKMITFYTTVGNRILTLKVNIPPNVTNPDGMSAADRKANLLKAAANSQAIFKGDCMTCHVNKGKGLLGGDLYVADCGICHDSPARASGVPDLHALKQPTDLEYWKTIITSGKARTLMPAFAASNGGPLSEAQVASLADYLNRTISRAPTSLIGSGIYNHEPVPAVH